MNQKNTHGKILIVDDVLENRILLASILSDHLSFSIMTASSGKTIFDAIDENVPDLILLDIMMPEMDGFEVAQKLKKNETTTDVPIIFITAKKDIDSKILAFQKGGVDYITKPFNREELLVRVNAQLQLKNLQDELKKRNHMLADREVHLMHLVEEKTQQIEKATLALVTALEDANLANDDDTGNHIRRVTEYSALLARAYGCDNQFVKQIKLYASLHDVGKVGIPDEILKKPGKYTPEEFDRMKEHVVIGGRMLDNAEIHPIAKNIAQYHHEKWDGSGYMEGLKGDEIPLEARIVALADVYDALVTKRVYKDAFPIQKAEEIITESKGSHFDPKVVALYFENREEMAEIKDRLK